MTGTDWFLIALAVFLHIFILVRMGIGALLVCYLVGGAIWFFAAEPGISIWTFFATNTVVVALMALGALVPGGIIGLAIVLVGGYFIGKGISEL